MNNKYKIFLTITVAVIVFSGFSAKNIISTNSYLKDVISSLQNKNLIEVFAQNASATFVTIAVPAATTNNLPTITGTCNIGDTMNFTIKYGPTYSTVSETINNYTCSVSPYSITPNIAIPKGKYKVEVIISQGGGGN